MSGFIDPHPDRPRIDRLEVLLTVLLRHVGLDALSPDARAIYDDLNSDDTARIARARESLHREFAADPLPDPAALYPEATTPDPFAIVHGDVMLCSACQGPMRMPADASPDGMWECPLHGPLPIGAITSLPEGREGPAAPPATPDPDPT